MVNAQGAYGIPNLVSFGTWLECFDGARQYSGNVMCCENIGLE
jgi:hypothetical protein